MNRQRWRFLASIVLVLITLLLVIGLDRWQSVTEKAASLSRVRLQYLQGEGEAVSIIFEGERELAWFRAGLRNPRGGLDERWGRVLDCQLVFGDHTEFAELLYAPDTQNAYIICFEGLDVFNDEGKHFRYKVDTEAPAELAKFLKGSIRQ